jgi:hypothetical protein
MRYLKLFNESTSTNPTIEDLDQIEDLFLSVADKFKMIQVDYPTSNHVFSHEDEIIYRVHPHFWNAGIESVFVRVVVLGWFESLTGEQSYDDIPEDVMDVYGDLVQNLDSFRERLQKFDYHPLPIKWNSDYYTEMVDGEEITTEGVSFTIQIKSKL